MIDRDEFLKFRINNAVKREKAIIVDTDISLGRIAVKSKKSDNITIGKFALSKRSLKRAPVIAHFITSDFDGIPPRQLWLPTELSLLSRTREIIPTGVSTSDIFQGWREVKSIVGDCADYSPYDEEGGSLFDEAKMLLDYADAADGSFKLSVSDG
jgi:hypothetical protein